MKRFYSSLVGVFALALAGAVPANTILIVDREGNPQVSPPPTGQGPQYFVSASCDDVVPVPGNCIAGLLGVPATVDANSSTAHTGVKNPSVEERKFLQDVLEVTVAEQYAESFSQAALQGGVFTTNREYFAVKQGGPGGGWTAFFKNVSGGYITLTIGPDFSHVTEIGAVVPIPPAFLLFGSALIGVGWLARRQRGRRDPAGMTQGA